ncbi:hypothetical protein Tsubulata_039242 [Turnera subulata]|uniref:Glycosyltransferase 61 catalytic domain-containing protein n=1 Tax=Turnera subulata TaxID=218843 RepID=A0A9Q0JGS8_9ROSI|nr:hypothetical protein Tsubulata_039242 [Turnera subulata]
MVFFGEGTLIIKWISAYDGGAVSPVLPELSGPITCNFSNKDYDICSMNGPALLDPMTSTFFTMIPTPTNIMTTAPSDHLAEVKIRPYPRKTDKSAMSKAKELTLVTSSNPPKSSSCGIMHSSPALIFSVGGYTGNFFHQFNEGFIPLYLTIHSFFPDRDVILVITDLKDWWAKKYADLFPHLTSHPIINMDNQTTTHCFPSSIVGLIKHGHLVIDPELLPYPKTTLLDFNTFLRNALGGDDDEHGTGRVLESYYNKPADQKRRRPRLVLVNRKGGVGREISNLVQVLNAIEEVGFQVIVFEPKRDAPVGDAYKLLQSSEAMLAVHGAAMTHLLLLRPGMVLGEIVPIGTDWLSKTFYEKPAKALGLEYIKYKVSFQESSLADKYQPSDLVIKDPPGFTSGNWIKARVYMKTQNVKLDIPRFKKLFLEEAYDKAKRLLGLKES